MSNNDIQVLKEIAHETPTAERIFTFFGMRERDRGAVDVVKLKRQLRKSGESIDDTAYDNLFSRLEKSGYGKRIKDYRGRFIAFKMTHPVYQVGKAAIEGQPLGEATRQKPRPVVKRAARTNPILTRQEMKAVKDNLAKALQAEKQKVSKPMAVKAEKTIVYCLVDGQRIKLQLEGDVNAEVVDRILATFEKRT